MCRSHTIIVGTRPFWPPIWISVAASLYIPCILGVKKAINSCFFLIFKLWDHLFYRNKILQCPFTVYRVSQMLREGSNSPNWSWAIRQHKLFIPEHISHKTLISYHTPTCYVYTQYVTPYKIYHLSPSQRFLDNCHWCFLLELVVRLALWYYLTFSICTLSSHL